MGLFATNGGVSSLVLRLVLGLVMFAHGSQKVLGWFGGTTLYVTLNMFTQKMHMPLPLAILVIAAEFLGGLGLIVGFLTRIAAFGIACDMIGAIALVHWKNGLFMNWFGNQKGEGFEYHLLVIAICIALIIRGAGALSLDHAIAGGSD
ncbi:MAG TPA: DoxX family protein [Candidatus Binataceae bacterium]|jgi:putative oxidoreductase|nr:DoxX family protein [Candidatus Binataceae bacterium]